MSGKQQPQRDQAHVGGQRSRADKASRGEPTAHPLLRLQRQLGNARVTRMLARQAALQRAPEDEDELQMQRAPEDEDELQMQRSAEIGPEGGQVSAGVAQSIQSKRGGGAPLAEGMLARMESSFGTSLGDVRVHSDAESHALNQQVGAKAFTTGSDVFLGRDSSAQDTRLMAHELTHVVQQRSMDVAGPMEVTPAGDRFEQEADTVADAVVRQG